MVAVQCLFKINSTLRRQGVAFGHNQHQFVMAVGQRLPKARMIRPGVSGPPSVRSLLLQMAILRPLIRAPILFVRSLR